MNPSRPCRGQKLTQNGLNYQKRIPEIPLHFQRNGKSISPKDSFLMRLVRDMAQRLPLLENESVVCVGLSGMIITSDGWIGEVRQHRHEGLSQIFRLLNISAIERKEWVDPISRRLAKGLFFFTVSISVILLILAPFLIGGTDAFWDGYDISGCIESSSDVWVCEEERGDEG
mgnify:CR=1 FL=1